MLKFKFTDEEKEWLYTAAVGLAIFFGALMAVTAPELAVNVAMLVIGAWGLYCLVYLPIKILYAGYCRGQKKASEKL